METKKKKNSLTRALAVILAVALVFGGGTFAYLQSQSEEVTNTFNTNTVEVELDETTGEEYEIVPGTSQEKDPTVTATYTQNAYVFVEVTDTTNDLVTWYIANGWTLLEDVSDEDEGTYVYYMLLETNYDAASGEWTEVMDSTSEYYGWQTYTDSSNGVTYYYDIDNDQYAAVISVLDGDKVYYSADITNEDMYDEYGNLLEDLQLTFVASAIQADPFQIATTDADANALSAYLAMTADSSTYATLGYKAMVNGALYKDFTEAINAALAAGISETTTVEVVSETTLSETLALTVASGSTADIVLDLNGNSITYTSSGDTTSIDSNETLIKVGEGVTLTITGNGTIDGTAMDDTDTEHELIYVNGGTLIIESGTFLLESTKGAVVCVGTPTNGTTGVVEIYGGTFMNSATSYAYGSTLSALTLNNINTRPGTITVYGGTFYGNDPANGDDKLGGTFVADGYTSNSITADGTTFYVVTVEEGASAVSLDVDAAALTLNEAIEAASALTTSNESTEITMVVSSGEYELLGSSSTATTIPAGTTITGAGTDETVLTIDCNSTTGGSTTGDGYTISTENVTLGNLSIVCTNMGTGYGNSALNITASGVVLDNVVMTGGTRDTYTASIYINGGGDENFTFTIKNSTIDNSSKAPFRALFVENLAGTLYIDNCTLDAVYPLNIMTSYTTAKVYFTDCTIHGWTSYSANVKSVDFTNCTFTKGSGLNTYDNVAAYTDTTFESCTFDSDFVVYAQTSGFTWNFNSCIKDGTAVTAENFKTLFPADSNVWTTCTCNVNGTQVTATE